MSWSSDPSDEDPDFTVIALERTNDPDALNHTGFDYLGAYGDGAAIDAWANEQPIEAIAKMDLPDPITFFPVPFDQA
jgi:hypothetical protein